MEENKNAFAEITITKIMADMVASAKFEETLNMVSSMGKQAMVPVVVKVLEVQKNGKAEQKLQVCVKDNGITIISNVKKDAKNGQEFDKILDIINGPHEAYINGIHAGVKLILHVEEKESLKTEFVSASVIDEIFEELKKEGFSEDEINERKEYLESLNHRLLKPEQTLYKKVFETLLKSAKSSKLRQRKPHVPYMEQDVNKGVIAMMLQKITKEKPKSVSLVGPKSVGKNVAWETIAWLLNAKLVTFNGGPRKTSADIWGYDQTDDSAKNTLTVSGLQQKIEAGKTGVWTDEALEYEVARDKSMSPTLKVTPGPFTEAMQSANEGILTILIVDEMNLCDPDVLGDALNTLTDSHSESVFKPGIGELKISENLIIGATQNYTGSEYRGTKEQNAATMSRFAFIEVKEQPSIVQHLIPICNKYSIPTSYALGFDKFYKAIQDAVMMGEDSISSKVLNIRGFKDAMEDIANGWSCKEALQTVIVGVLDPEEQAILENMLDSLVDATGNFA